MMFGPRPPMNNNVSWNHHGPPMTWRHNFGPRASLRGHQRFHSQQRYNPQLQQGNENYWCETCDRGFFTEDILNKHKQQHQKCNIDGCQFVAHPKVITKHIQMQHSTGLYKKISNINKPEEIEKWREERRKRYPTKANIDKKAALLKEKIERGEKMGLDRSKNKFIAEKTDKGFKRKNTSGNENLPRSRFKRNRNSSNVTKTTTPKKLPQPLPSLENNRKLKPFSGILNLDMGNDNEIIESNEVCELIEDDISEGFINNDILVDPDKPVVCGALSSLICDYGSTDEEDNVETLNANTQSTKHVTKVTEISNKEVNIIFAATPNNKDTVIDNSVIKDKLNAEDPNPAKNDDNDSGPEEVNVIKKDDLTIPPAPFKDSSQQENLKKRRCIVKKQNFRQAKPKLPSTLLQKLLQREMQQERNIVLQCIRYIRKNNYFDGH